MALFDLLPGNPPELPLNMFGLNAAAADGGGGGGSGDIGGSENASEDGGIGIPCVCGGSGGRVTPAAAAAAANDPADMGLPRMGGKRCG